MKESKQVSVVWCVLVLLKILTCSSRGLLFIHSGRVLSVSPITASFHASLTRKHHKASSPQYNSKASLTLSEFDIKLQCNNNNITFGITLTYLQWCHRKHAFIARLAKCPAACLCVSVSTLYSSKSFKTRSLSVRVEY